VPRPFLFDARLSSFGAISIEAVRLDAKLTLYIFLPVGSQKAGMKLGRIN
jgi:hypothetical protein